MATILLDHNIQPYSDLEAMLATKHKAMVVTTTGAGKTSVALKYLEDHNLHGLAVCPKRSICRQWEETSDRVKAITYQKFCNLPSFGDYGCYIFDEAHHTGAPKWGMAVKTLMDSTVKPIIGLTADPKRYLDNGRDMGQELWDGNVVYGVDMDEAIQQGILPKPIFVCALFDGGEEFAKYRNLPITDKLKGRLEASLRNCLSIHDILHEHMPEGKRKGIVFVDSIDRIQESMSLLQAIYPFSPIFNMHSGLPRKVNEATAQKFNDIDDGFVVTVDMLNEGVHTQGVNTIIMLRRTSSPNVFMQQLGRGISPDSKDVAIFDFVGNNCNLKIISQRISQVGEATQTTTPSAPKYSTQFISYDYVTPILSVVEDIKVKLAGKWTEDEDNILRANYPTMGTKVSAMLPGRTKKACEQRAHQLDIGIVSPWTKVEDDILRVNYPTMGVKVTTLLPGRTESSCKYRASFLKISNTKAPPWSQAEDNIIRINYPTMKSETATMLPGRSKSACKNRARYLGVIGNSPKPWTPSEIKILKDNYSEMGANVSTLLPGRAKTACRTKAHQLGLSEKKSIPWTQSEEDVLRTHYLTLGKKVADLLPGRTELACHQRAHKLGLDRDAPVNEPWTQNEDNILRTNYPQKGKMVKNLLPGRTEGACLKRAYQLGLTGNKYRAWTEDEDAILHANYPKMGINVVELLPGRTKDACYGRARQLGLKYHRP